MNTTSAVLAAQTTMAHTDTEHAYGRHTRLQQTGPCGLRVLLTRLSHWLSVSSAVLSAVLRASTATIRVGTSATDRVIRIRRMGLTYSSSSSSSNGRIVG
jgi:hypothetical protein